MCLPVQVQNTKSMCETQPTKTHIWFHSACLEFFCLLASDYFPSPHAAFAGGQQNYAERNSALPVHQVTEKTDSELDSGSS